MYHKERCSLVHRQRRWLDLDRLAEQLEEELSLIGEKEKKQEKKQEEEKEEGKEGGVEEGKEQEQEQE